MMSLGVVIILVSAFGYLSNMLNWRFLNYKITHLLYYIGAFVHETSHAILCVLTGAKIEEFTVFSDQPHVVYRPSKIPFLGALLISAAPIAGGLFFLFLVNRFLLGNYFVVAALSGIPHWRDLLTEPFALVRQINLLQWQSWVMILLFFNVGAMLGPSTRDLKNIWLLLIVLLFIHWSFLENFGLIAASLIIINIVLQVVVIAVLGIMKIVL
jgi:hypothetical protein